MTAPRIREPIFVPAAGRYRIDPVRSRVAFTTRHLFGLGVVHGAFALQNGEIRVAARVEDSQAWAIVAAASICTGNAGRDRTVRSAGLLDVEAHPRIAFVSQRLTDAGGEWTLHGQLTVRNATRAVALRLDSVDCVGPEQRVGATARIDRYAFGVTRYRGVAARHLHIRLDLLAVRSRAEESFTG